MRPLRLILPAIACFVLFSCKSQGEFNKRQYTQGQYHDLLFGKNKSEKQDDAECLSVENDKVADTAQSITRKDLFRVCADVPRSSIVQMDSAVTLVGRVMQTGQFSSGKKDSVNIFNDTIPEPISTALSGQALVSLAVVGAAATTVAPSLIWFSSILIFAAPFCFLVSLFAGCKAYGMIASGQLDKRYRRYMRIWAIAMILNTFFALLLISKFIA